MNEVNLLKAAYYLYTQVPAEIFDMQVYRMNNSLKNKYCRTVGCAMGHLTAIIPEDKILRDNNKRIFFLYTGKQALDINSNQYSFLFSGYYANLDNSIKGACQRILYLLTSKRPNLDVKSNHPYKKINVLKTYNKLKKIYEKSS